MLKHYRVVGRVDRRSGRRELVTEEVDVMDLLDKKDNIMTAISIWVSHLKGNYKEYNILSVKEL